MNDILPCLLFISLSTYKVISSKCSESSCLSAKLFMYPFSYIVNQNTSGAQYNHINVIFVSYRLFGLNIFIDENIFTRTTNWLVNRLCKI